MKIVVKISYEKEMSCKGVIFLKLFVKESTFQTVNGLTYKLFKNIFSDVQT